MSYQELDNDYKELDDSHYDYFVRCFKGWSEYIGITDWMVEYSFRDDDDDYRAATFIYCTENRLAGVVLSNSWDVDPTDYALSKTAFHEALELLFADLTILAGKREYNEGTYDKERHRVIRMLERSLFNRMWNNGYDILDFQSDAKSGGTAGSPISEIHSDETLPDTWVQRIKSKSRRFINSLSPF